MRKKCPIIFLVLGVALNLIVIQANEGRMPVWAYFEYSTKEHFVITNAGEVNYLPLSDIYNFAGRIWSLGDLLYLFGFSLFILGQMLIQYNYLINYLIKKKNG